MLRDFRASLGRRTFVRSTGCPPQLFRPGPNANILPDADLARVRVRAVPAAWEGS